MEIFGVSRDTIYSWCDKGFLTPKRTPTNQLMFDAAEVERLRNGEHQHRRPARQQTLDEDQVATDERPKADSQKDRSWKELPPWEAEVAEARAALTVDELASLRERQAEERETAKADTEARL